MFFVLFYLNLGSELFVKDSDTDIDPTRTKKREDKGTGQNWSQSVYHSVGTRITTAAIIGEWAGAALH